MLEDASHLMFSTAAGHGSPLLSLITTFQPESENWLSWGIYHLHGIFSEDIAFFF